MCGYLAIWICCKTFCVVGVLRCCIFSGLCSSTIKSLKRSSYLPRNKLLDLYFKIILPSVSYPLPIWGSFTNKDGFLALESLHCRAAKLIYGLLRDMPAVEVYKIAKWDSLHFMYKVKLTIWAYKIFYDCTPESSFHGAYINLRTKNKVIVLHYNTYFMKNSIVHRASIVWNLLTPDLAKTSNVKNYTRMASRSDDLRSLDFRAECSQTMPHNNNDNFLYYWDDFNIFLMLKF